MVSKDCDNTIGMREKLLLLIRNETGVMDATDDTPIEALGIDSLDFVSLLQALRSLGKIDTRSAVEARTVGDIIAAVKA